MIKALLFDFGGTILVEERDKHLGDMELRLVAGVESFLRWAYWHYALMVVSNTVESYAADIQQVLVQCGVSQYFKDVVTSLDYGSEKPDPSIFQFACARLGVKPQEAVMIGDRVEKDIRGAKRAGLRAVLLHLKPELVPQPQSPFDQPDLVVASFQEIVTYLNALGQPQNVRVP